MKKTLLLILLSLISFSAIYAETYTLSPNGTLNIYGTTMNDYTNLLGSMAPWHDKREQIKKVVIQDGMTNIGEFAFCDCPNLSDIIIPTSVKTIRRGAFSYCKSLTSFTIPNTITRIEDDLFAFSSRLTSVTIPNSVTSIGDNAFSYCESLTSITIPNSVTSIEDNAFTFCKSLTSIVIPKSVTSIEAPVFFGCLNLTSIKVENGNTHYDSRNNCNAIIETGSNTLIAGCTKTLIPSSVTSIGESVFSFLSNLTSITIPNSVTSIGEQAFWGCVKLKSITIPNSVKSIGDYAFEDCSSLTSITIPNSVTSIAVAAFRKCTSLTSITIPNSVTKIGKDAFKECTGLTSIFCEAVTPPECGSGCFYGVPNNIPIYVPSNSISAYKEAYQWKNFPNIQAKIEPTGISFLNTKLTIRVGVKKKLKAIITPEAATIKTITWTSSNTEVATISADGTVTAKGTGTSVITAKTYNGKTAQCTLTVIQAVTEISLSETNASLWVGKTKTLTATVAPTTASNPSVEWSSSDNKVATVSSKGVISAKGKGTCTITCTAADGYGAKTTCEVTVKQQITEIALSETTASLWIGDTKTITATATPTTANNTNVTWSSSDKNVATVSSKGVITAKGKGTCTITCTAADGYGTKSTCEVTVKQQVTEIALSETSASLWVGDTKTIKATASPTTASNTNVTWSSSDKNVATVSSKGVITAKGKGTCTITCTAADGYGARITCEVTVKQQVTEIALSETTVSLWVGDTKTIKATASPTTANNTNVTWSSSDKNVATVSSKGVITAKGEGTCTITCTAADGFGTKSICEVTVKQQPTSIEELQIANTESPIYNLNGQRINNSNAHKGIYIKNGKKYAK